MLKLHNGDFQTLTKFIFDFYDFDKDGNIKYEDVNQIQLLILPSQYHSEEVFKFIKDSLDSFFGEYKLMSYESFVEITENFDSDIFMNMLIYLYTNKPFSNEIIGFYNTDKRVGEEANLIRSSNDLNGSKDFSKKFAWRKIHTECDMQEKRRSFLISKQYHALFDMNHKYLGNNKPYKHIDENDNIRLSNINEQKVSDFKSKKLSLISVTDKNIRSNKQTVNVLCNDYENKKYTNNFENLESFCTNNFLIPKFGDKKEKKILINFNPIENDNNESNNFTTLHKKKIISIRFKIVAKVLPILI